MGKCLPDCGMCCHPVVTQYTQLQVELGEVVLDDDEREWVLNDLTRMRVKDALALAPHLRGRTLCDAEGNLVIPVYYRCRHYDEDTKTCRNYDNRPGACRDFPWYGEEPNPAKTLPPGCGYWEDVPEPVPVRLGRKPFIF